MIDKEIIEDALVSWLSGVTGGVVIIADQGKPRPTTDYATIKILTFLPIGTDGIEQTALPTDLVQIDYSTNFDILVSLNFFRDNSFLNASKARGSFSLTSVIEDLESNGLFFKSTSDIRNINEVIKKQNEDRYQIDISFYIRSTTTEIIEQIKKIQLTNELDDSTVIIT